MSSKDIVRIIYEYLSIYRVRKDGVETVTVVEDGVVVSKTVNGQPAALEGSREPGIEGPGRSKSREKS